jgi:hypothetical protein
MSVSQSSDIAKVIIKGGRGGNLGLPSVPFSDGTIDIFSELHEVYANAVSYVPFPNILKVQVLQGMREFMSASA